MSSDASLKETPGSPGTVDTWRKNVGKPLEPATYRFGSFAGQDCVESQSSNSDTRSNEGQPAPRKQHQPRGSGIQFRHAQYSRTPNLHRSQRPDSRTRTATRLSSPKSFPT